MTPDTAPGHTEPVDADTALPAAASPAVRAVMRIALRHGCSLSREAAEQIVGAVLALDRAPLEHGQTREVPVER